MEKGKKDILEELKEYYNNGYVSALIGAGFSKNVSDSYLGWGELIHDMVGELYEIDINRHYDNYLHQSYGVLPDPKPKEVVRDEYISDICKYEDYLELVSKYIQKKGLRESLEVYIESRIPYATFNSERKIVLKTGNQEKEEVSVTNFSAHKELLLLDKLQNIYTTNYENLIEFTIDLWGASIPNLPNVVRNGRDLSDKIRSRNVIKIHGDLRQNSNGKISFDGDNKLQYIISKEDYDTYKEKHEAFTSLMRIAMLQGKFMLLGFSGMDANYKGWVTWMSDILEGENDDVTKIYIIDVSGKDTRADLQLYYDNHHTKVINLIDEERLRVIGFNDSDVVPILQKQEDKKIDNDTKREILTMFLRFLGTSVSGSEEFINVGSQSIQEVKDKENEKVSSVDSSNGTSLAAARKGSFDYRKLWREALSKIDNIEAFDEIVKKIKEAKSQNRFPKVVVNQGIIIPDIAQKSKLNNNDAFLLALAMDEYGVNPHYYSQIIQDYEELDKLPLWNLLRVKEASFNGDDATLDNSEDEFVYEIIQRNLFHLNFEKASDLIEKWEPQSDFVVQKAMRLAAMKGQKDIAFKMLSEYIKTENRPVEKLYAVQIANFISDQFPRPYSTDEFYQYGIDGIGDMLEYMVQQLKGKSEPPRTRGWIGSTMNFGGSYPDYEKSLRILRYISDCGLFISYGITSFMDRAHWYFVFQNLYDIFPYPCFFYSIQYSENNLLTRIGQDFAYSPKLCEFNEKIIVKAIQAYGASNTPQIFLTGILLVTGPIYISVDEEKWFDVFKNNIFNKLIENFDKLNFSDPIVKNVEYALVCLKNTQHISIIFEELIAHYHLNHALVNSFIRYNLRIKHIKNNIPSNIWKSLKDLIVDYPSVDITELFYLLEENDIMTKDVKQLFVEKVKEIGEDNLPHDSSALFYLCCLTKDDTTVLKIAKKLLLKHDIWHCGALEDGKTWSTPNYIRLNVFPKEIKWTVTEFNIIKNNLDSNINKYKEVHNDLHGETLMRNAQVQYLSDILQFIDGLSESRKNSLKKIREDVERLLNERVSYQTLIEGILSEQTIDADYAMNNVIQGVKAKGFDNYLNEVNFILDRAIIGDSLIINALLQKISMLVENYKDEINEADLCPKLHTLLTIYKSHWADYHEFRPAWSFSHLYVIAKYLKERGFGESESVAYWMNDPFVQTFIRA